MCFWCLRIGFKTPETNSEPLIINISQSYGRGGTNVAPGKRHIVVQCNNLFNKAIISRSEAEGNQRNIEHVVKMLKLLTNIDKYVIIVDHCPVLDNLSLAIYPF